MLTNNEQYKRTRTAVKKERQRQSVISGPLIFYSTEERTIKVGSISSDLWGFGLAANDKLRVPVDVVVAHDGRSCYSYSYTVFVTARFLCYDCTAQGTTSDSARQMTPFPTFVQQLLDLLIVQASEVLNLPARA